MFDNDTVKLAKALAALVFLLAVGFLAPIGLLTVLGWVRH